ncbi:MAG: ubiquinol-cytochrome c reductase iron-sulfur subunit [Cyanobacteria bacterium J06632_22]
MERREFLTWMGVGGLAASLPVALAACNSETAEVDPAADAPAADVPAGGPEVVGTLSDIEGSGFILNESASVGPVLVVAQAGDPSALQAVNPTCPHAGCTVAWETDSGEMVCPCHNSRFSADGAVLQGPANEGLEAYAVSVEGDNILVGPA